ncbi:MAG: hypothetical protein MUC73_14815 [Cyclobacteriaceae bacterium]|nr:hypothetical protein [Cyclobacteriaceae bacterium]
MKRHSGPAFAGAASRRQACAGIPLSTPQIGIAPMHRGNDKHTFETDSL